MNVTISKNTNLIHLTIIGIASLLVSCNNSSPAIKKQVYKTDTIQTETKKAIPAMGSDTLVIDKQAAVFFTADSAHAERFKAKFGAGAYDGTDHECFYQMKNSRTSLKEHWPQVHIYEVKSNTVLLFVKEDGQKTIIDLSQKNDLCGLFIFNRKKDPLPADMMGIGTSLETYFLK